MQDFELIQLNHQYELGLIIARKDSIKAVRTSMKGTRTIIDGCEVPVSETFKDVLDKLGWTI